MPESEDTFFDDLKGKQPEYSELWIIGPPPVQFWQNSVHQQNVFMT